MTTFGVDFHTHLEATKRKDIPYIMEKCIDTLDDIGLPAKGLYRVSGVKSKVEKLCQV
jgi:RhoGAP domain.